MENLGRKLDHERLKQLRNAQSKDAPAATKTVQRKKAAPPQRSTKAIIPASDDEEDDEDRQPKRKPAARGKQVKAPAAANKRKGGKRKLESDDEEEDAESEKEDEADDEEEAEEEEEEEEEEHSEDDDDLFNSDEEEAINNRYKSTATADDEDEEDDDGPKTKTLRKRGRGSKISKKKRSAWDDDEDEEEDEDDEDVDEDEEVGRRSSRGGKRSRRDALDDDERYQEDGDIGRIKKSYRTNKETAAESQRSERVTASKEIVVNSLDDYKRLLMASKSGIDSKSGKGYAPVSIVNPAEDDNQQAVYSDYLRIFLRREDIAKVLHEPYLEDYLKGCYVKYLIGSNNNQPVYRACEIVGIGRTEKAYKIGTAKGEEETKVYLKLSSKGEIADRRKLDKVSNHTITEKEIESQIEGLLAKKITPPTKRDIRVKRQRMKDFRSYIYSEQEVQSMIATRQGDNQVFTTDYTSALAVLQKQLLKVTQEKDFDAMELTRKEIEKIEYENERQKRLYEKSYKAQTDVNRRMRELNTKHDMEAGMRKREQDLAAQARGEVSNAISDPFIRRETRPKNLWISQHKRPQPEGAAAESQEKAKAAAPVEPAKAKTADKANGSKGSLDDAWVIPLVPDVAQVT